jgi:hypothetical protein
VRRIAAAVLAAAALAGCGGQSHHAVTQKLKPGPAACPGYQTQYGCAAHSPTFGLPPSGPPKLTAPSSTPTVAMYDSVTLSVIPAHPPAVAGYLSGLFPTFGHLAADFPGALRVPIAIHALPVYPSLVGRMACLDVEPLDATPAQSGPWARGEIRLGVKPCLYSALKNGMAQVLVSLRQWLGSGWRSKVFLWDADWTGSPRLDAGFDATQWTDHYLNRNVDASVDTHAFLGIKPPPPPLPVCLTHRIARSSCAAAKAKIARDLRAESSSNGAYDARACPLFTARVQWFGTRLREHPKVKTASRKRALAASRAAYRQRSCAVFKQRADFFSSAVAQTKAVS